MDERLLFLAALSAGGGAAVAALAFFSRSTRSRYGARWRCWAWLLLALRLAIPIPLLPEHVPSNDALRYAMLHELTHFRRRDIWLKSLVLWANALHWFNPLVWYMTRLVERDTELACDEAALRALPAGEHRAYGQTILDAVGQLKQA